MSTWGHRVVPYFRMDLVNALQDAKRALAALDASRESVFSAMQAALDSESQVLQREIDGLELAISDMTSTDTIRQRPHDDCDPMEGHEHGRCHIEARSHCRGGAGLAAI